MSITVPLPLKYCRREEWLIITPPWIIKSFIKRSIRVNLRVMLPNYYSVFYINIPCVGIKEHNGITLRKGSGLDLTFMGMKLPVYINLGVFFIHI
jgi:hypothetical protein